MNFQEVIQLKALELKQLHTQGVGDTVHEHLLEQALKTPEGQALTRNICAHVSIDLFQRVEGCCSMLNLSKRQFVEMALKEALDRADAIVDQVDPFAEG